LNSCCLCSCSLLNQKMPRDEYERLVRMEFWSLMAVFLFAAFTFFAEIFAFASPFWWMKDDNHIWNGLIYMCWEVHGTTEYGGKNGVKCSLYTSECTIAADDNPLFSDPKDCKPFRTAQNLFIACLCSTFLVLILMTLYIFCPVWMRKVTTTAEDSAIVYVNRRIVIIVMSYLLPIALLLASLFMFRSVVNTTWYEGQNPAYGVSYYTIFVIFGTIGFTLISSVIQRSIEKKIILLEQRHDDLTVNNYHRI
jgi:hypothetical protein